MTSVFLQCNSIKLSKIFNKTSCKIYDDSNIEYQRLDTYIEKTALSYQELVVIIELCCNYIHAEKIYTINIQDFYVSKNCKNILYNIPKKLSSNKHNNTIYEDYHCVYLTFFDALLIHLMKKNNNLYFAYTIYCSNFMKKLA